MAERRSGRMNLYKMRGRVSDRRKDGSIFDTIGSGSSSQLDDQFSAGLKDAHMLPSPVSESCRLSVVDDPFP